MAKTTKKETAKVVEAPKAEVKTEVKAEAPKAAAVEKKAPAAKKVAEKKAPVAKKAPAAKKAPVAVKTVEIQMGEQAISYDAIIKKVTKAAKDAKVVNVYVKVDENKIYYVADKNETQSIDLF